MATCNHLLFFDFSFCCEFINFPNGLIFVMMTPFSVHKVCSAFREVCSVQTTKTWSSGQQAWGYQGKPEINSIFMLCSLLCYFLIVYRRLLFVLFPLLRYSYESFILDVRWQMFSSFLGRTRRHSIGKQIIFAPTFTDIAGFLPP